MDEPSEKFDNYYSHLNEISFLGKLYKRYFVSPILFLIARKFGPSIVEIGSGIASGVLGTFPKSVIGLEVNPLAVKYCRDKGLDVGLIHINQPYPTKNDAINACVLDNVLEHIPDAKFTLDQCSRITKKDGGLVIAVPGIKGYLSDSDHKVFYDEEKFQILHQDWVMTYSFSTPLFFKSNWLSKNLRQYCLVAVYRKK